MGSHVVLLVIFLCYYNILFVDKAQCTRNLYKEEDLELGIQSKLSKKSSIKTIQDKYGDIIDCVDVNKQLAFQTSLLKNHTIKRQIISSLLYYNSSKHNNSTESMSSGIYRKDEMCLFGTIPIRRITTDQAKVMNRPHTYASTVFLEEYLAVSRTIYGPWTGGKCTIRIDNPKATGHQYSAARIRIVAGHNTIEAGWRVDPDLYGDSSTRFFIRTDAGKTHCFNLRCPGFIQIYSAFPLDSIIAPVATPERPVSLLISIFRDADETWNLRVGDKDHANNIIGYWPKEIFPEMADGVEWGGVAYSPPGTPLPPMGSGNKLTGDPHYGFVNRMITTDFEGELHYPNYQLHATNSKQYPVRDGGYTEKKGHTLLYGGPVH